MQTSEQAPNPDDAAPAPAALPHSLTEDGFLGGRLSLLQPEKGFRAGIDSVFLAASVPCAEGDGVFEAGVGTGVAALCLLARCPGTQLTGVELAARHVMLAEENAKRNGLGPRLRVIHAEVREALASNEARMPPRGSFRHAIANPPFFEDGRSTPSPHLLKAQSHGFGPDELVQWVKLLHVMLKPRGTATLVHRAETLPQILAAMHNRFGDIRVAPLFPRAGVAASRVIVQGIKGSRAPLQLLPGLVLHGEGNAFTAEAEAVLREGAAFPLR